MFLNPKKQPGIQGHIIEYLLENGPTPAPHLMSILVAKKVSTKPGFYRALSELRNAEIVVKTKKIVSLSRLWLERLNTKIDHLIGRDTHPHIVTLLQENNSVTYSFNDIVSSDVYWSHVFYELVQAMPKNIPIVLYMYHEWFFVARRSFEEKLYLETEQKGHLILLTVGGSSTQDKYLKKTYSSEGIKINTGNDFGFRQNYYVNVFGDFILEATIDANTAQNVDDWYNQETRATISPPMEKEVEDIINSMKSIKIKVSRNAKKAAKLRKKMSRDFFIPKGYLI